MPTFTDMAVNADNLICIARRPLEIVCLLVKRLFGRSRSKTAVTLQWRYLPSAPGATPLPPHMIISCHLDKASVKECLLLPLAFRRQVTLEITYQVKAIVTYCDIAGNIGIAVLRKELRRRSRPMPGNLFMSSAARVTLDLVDCRINSSITNNDPRAAATP